MQDEVAGPCLNGCGCERVSQEAAERVLVAGLMSVPVEERERVLATMQALAGPVLSGGVASPDESRSSLRDVGAVFLVLQFGLAGVVAAGRDLCAVL